MNRPALMGIVNVTPDSFSGDGKLADDAVRHAEALLDAGADILDIGAESTRPGATALTAEMEWTRLEPVLTKIIGHHWRSRVRLSVDTRHAVTAARALALGVDIINDVSGMQDPEMAKALAEHSCDVVVMHALSVPAESHNVLPPDCDVVAEILRWKKRITEFAKAHGIAPERLIYDPGIGFGKSAEQSLRLIEQAAELKQSGGRWLVGHSRKSFLKLVTEKAAGDRDGPTLEYSRQLAQAGIDYLRVHDVQGHADMFERLCT